jgi:plastocyanin
MLLNSTRATVTLPSLAAQSINPIFRLSATQTLPQAAFNTAVLGRSLRNIPPYAFGTSPYGMSGLATTYGAMMPAYGGGYGGGGYGGGGYGGSMMTTSGYGGGGAAASPYSNIPTAVADQSGADSAAYPAVASTGQVEDARVTTPAPTSMLVSSTAPDRPASTRDIWIHDGMFSPGTIWVTAGTTVRWINYGYGPHSVASMDGLWDSGPMRRGVEFSVTFTQPGTYRYQCRYHPDLMAGVVIVSR